MRNESAASVLIGLQKAQLGHDETFHREIVRLDLSRRLTHMALHIAKYFGRLCQTEFVGLDDPHSKAIADRSWLDSFIIATSTSNIINVALSQLWKLEPQIEIGDLPQWLQKNSLRLGISGSEQVILASITEQLTNTCEKMDHLERVNYRDEIGNAVGRLSALSFLRLSKKNQNVAALVQERLLETKKKSIFFT